MKESVTRLDAARRQLCQAIRLFFAEGDSVSTHTLACAAHEILSVLTRHAHHVVITLAGAKGSFLFDNPFVKAEMKKEYLNLIKKDYNFFKHASKDPSVRVDFDSERTEFFLFDAACMYHAFAGRWLYPGFVYYMWFSLKRPNIVLQDSALRTTIDSILRNPNGLSRANKKDYLEFLDDEVMLQRLGSTVDVC